MTMDTTTAIPPIVAKLMTQYGLSEADARAMAGLPATKVAVGDKTPSIDGSGRAYIIGADGKPQYLDVTAMPVNQNPGHTSTTSSSTSQNYQDPEALRIQREQNTEAARQFDAQQKQRETDNAAQAKQNLAVLAGQAAQLQQTIAAQQQNAAIANANLDFLKSKETWSQQFQTSQEARMVSGQVFQQQAAVTGLQLQIQTLVQQHQQVQAQMDQQVALANATNQQSASEFNATMGFNVDKANADAQARQQDQLGTLATNIGTLGANSGDRGKLATYTLANSGWSQQNAGLPGMDFRTSASLMPLDTLLKQRDATAKPLTPFSYTPINPAMATAARLAPLDLSAIQLPQAPAVVPASGGAAPVQSAPAGAPPPDYSAIAGLSAADLSAGKGIGAISGQVADPGAAATALGIAFQNAGLMHAAEGGMIHGAYVGDEKGSEIHIPLAAGVAYVIPAKVVAKMGPDKVKALRKMQSGGIFNASLFTDPNAGQDVSEAQGFLGSASQVARKGTPWADGSQLPSPVFASSPGFDPGTANLIASLSALETGTPQDYWLRQAGMLAPQGATQVPTRRTG